MGGRRWYGRRVGVASAGCRQGARLQARRGRGCGGQSRLAGWEASWGLSVWADPGWAHLSVGQGGFVAGGVAAARRQPARHRRACRCAARSQVLRSLRRHLQAVGCSGSGGWLVVGTGSGAGREAARAAAAGRRATSAQGRWPARRHRGRRPWSRARARSERQRQSQPSTVTHTHTHTHTHKICIDLGLAGVALSPSNVEWLRSLSRRQALRAAAS